MLAEFKTFLLKTNALALAIGVIIGAALGGVVSSLVNDIIMPPIGMLLGKVDFTSLFITLSGGSYNSLKAAQDAGAVTINYGVFINTIIEFLIVALVVFLLIKQLNRLTAKPPAPAGPATTKDCPYCFSNIPIKATRCPNCTSELAAS